MLEGAAGHAPALLTRAQVDGLVAERGQSVSSRLVTATNRPSPPASRSRRTASRVSAEPPEADTATTVVPGPTTGSRSEAASSATAGIPWARSRAAATWLA